MVRVLEGLGCLGFRERARLLTHSERGIEVQQHRLHRRPSATLCWEGAGLGQVVGCGLVGAT